MNDGTAWSYVTKHPQLKLSGLMFIVRTGFILAFEDTPLIIRNIQVDDVSSGLAYLHENGVIHSDLKAASLCSLCPKRRH